MSDVGTITEVKFSNQPLCPDCGKPLEVLDYHVFPDPHENNYICHMCYTLGCHYHEHFNRDTGERLRG